MCVCALVTLRRDLRDIIRALHKAHRERGGGAARTEYSVLSLLPYVVASCSCREVGSLLLWILACHWKYSQQQQ